ncbi:MAG: cation diffusion facilitator family transporter [Sporichthyaceae bacterium]
MSEAPLPSWCADAARPDAHNAPVERRHGHRHGHGHGHGHSHAVSADADRRYLWIALVLLSAFMVVEVVVALAIDSLVLLADAGHMLTDALAIAAALWAMRLAARPATARWTYGLKRAEILSACANGVTLLVVGAIIAVEAVQRLFVPPEVEGGGVLAVAVVGVVVNVAATAVLARANRSSLNVEGAFQHVLTDLYAFVGTAVAGVVILLTGFDRADAIASLVVVALMLYSGWGLVRESGHILLQGTPAQLDLADVSAHLLSVDHVRDVHDLHAWTVTSGLPSLSAHVVVDDECFTDGHAAVLLCQLQRCLVGHFDVEHSTFQLEPAGHREHETGAHN